MDLKNLKKNRLHHSKKLLNETVHHYFFIKNNTDVAHSKYLR